MSEKIAQNNLARAVPFLLLPLKVGETDAHPAGENNHANGDRDQHDPERYGATPVPEIFDMGEKQNNMVRAHI